MPFNSFFGKRQIIKAMAIHPRAESIAPRTSLPRNLFLLVGPIAIRLFGWPWYIEARALSKYVFNLFSLQIGGGQRILDAGGSYGVYSFELAKRGCNVTTIDVDANNLELGKTIKDCLKANVTLARMDICQIGFRDATFDCVLMSHVLEHIKDDQQTIKEIHRVLKPGGILLLAFPHSDEPVEYAEAMLTCNGRLIPTATPEAHWRSGYSRKTIANLLHNHGFFIESANHYAPTLIHSPALFSPLVYPLSFLFSLLVGKSHRAMLVKAKSMKKGTDYEMRWNEQI